MEEQEEQKTRFAIARIMALTFGSELILEFNEDKGRLGGLELTYGERNR